jgi:L-ascorbate metabolism protein UlaG (beta-lactamase superfamily)
MELRLIRHATMLVRVGTVTLLIDPIFSPAGFMPPIDNSANDRRNPLVELPISEDELMKADAVLLTHTHRDHFDAAAAERLPKGIMLFCQPADEQKLKEMGFYAVCPVKSAVTWNGVNIHRTGGEHGTGDIGEKMGPVSGYVLRLAGEPSVYIAGDTIWCPEVEQVLANAKPDVVVLFSGAAQFLTGDPITMTDWDVIKVCRKAPAARIVIVHMETFNHCPLTRRELSEALNREGLIEQVFIPCDGEILSFSGI